MAQRMTQRMTHRSGARERVWRAGEDLAAAELQGQGLAVVARNWRCSLGEIDIVAEDVEQGVLVFCEVKTRTGLGFGDPLEAITWAKLRKLRQLAAEFLSIQHRPTRRIRLDAIGVLLLPDQQPRVTHVRGIG